MIDQYYIKPQTRDRIRASWLGEPIQRYVTWLHDQGYAARNVFRRVPILMHFAEFAQASGAKTCAELPHHVPAFVQQWVRERGNHARDERARRSVGSTARNPIEQMLRLVLPGFAGSGRRHLPDPFAGNAPGFFIYLDKERGLRPATLDLYRHDLHGLEAYLKRIGLVQLTDLSVAITSAFVTERAQRLGKNAIVSLCSSLRVFLRYLHRERLLSRDLSQSVDAPKRYRMAEIPRSISWADVQRMLEGVDRRSGLGRRDYAILLLLVTYGLRSREIAALTLEDLDWERERLRVPERKAGHSTAYPLSPVVGAAILDYLKAGRPKTAQRQLFFRSLAPWHPLSCLAVSQCATRYLKKAGIAVARPGSHTLRHT